MPKDCVYQLRLTSEEKAKLAFVAKGRESSIAQMIRQDYGLDLGREPESVKERPAKASVETPRPVGSTPTPSAHSASEIKRLAMQRHGHLPLGFAERKVREELS